MKHLTGLPINYLITVNFHGFKEVVDKLGGVWMDVDRRYYNKNTGASYDNYANINLQPGYQRLDGPAGARLRPLPAHGLRPLPRRAAAGVRARDQGAGRAQLLVHRASRASSARSRRTSRSARAAAALQGDQVISYALFAQSLPGGHLFQEKIENVHCAIGCTASSSDIQAAVDQFQNPDVQAPKDANAAALGQKVKQKAPPPSSVTVTVLNGSGVQGAAANASYLLAQRGYETLTPPNGLTANGPPQRSTRMIYYDPAQKRSKAAAVALQNLMQPADIAKLPRTPELLALDPGSMLMVVLGTAFHGTIAPLPARVIPTHQPAFVRYDAAPAADLLRPYVKKVPFHADGADRPRALLEPRHASGRQARSPTTGWTTGASTRRSASSSTTATTSTGASRRRTGTARRRSPTRASATILGGREFDLYYSGSHLHMVVLRQHGATYWVVNTLLDSLSNETMLAIAKGLKPLTSVH